MSGHPSAAGRAQDRERPPAKDRHSTTEPTPPTPCAKLRQNQSFHLGDIAIFRIFEMAVPPCCIFKIAKFYCLARYRGSRRISMLNFVKIGQSVAKILLNIFRLFKLAAVSHLGFVWGIFGPFTESTWGLYHFEKFGYDRCHSLDNMNVSIFGVFGWKISYSRSQNFFLAI